MKVASWNVNSIRVRMPTLTEWLKAEEPDVLCLQETKVVDQDFPAAELATAGYRSLYFGQKTYNGVAILCRDGALAFELLRMGLPGEAGDAGKRLIAARTGDVSVVNVYVPNGQEVGSDRYAGKLEWLDRLRAYLASDFSPQSPLVVCGDFNIAPEDRDVFDPDGARGSIMFSDAEQAALRGITEWGLSDSLRLRTQEGGLFSWWDYRGAAFRKNEGWRIDLILCTAPLATRCTQAGIDPWPRKQPRPSDHTPIYAVFS